MNRHALLKSLAVLGQAIAVPRNVLAPAPERR